MYVCVCARARLENLMTTIIRLQTTVGCVSFCFMHLFLKRETSKNMGKHIMVNYIIHHKNRLASLKLSNKKSHKQ